MTKVEIKPNKYEGAWFIYDGECEICSFAVKATKIKKTHGSLHALNARTDVDHPLVQYVKETGFDLDEGMVIIANSQCYHGKDALRFMSRYGESKNAFMLFIRSLFWSDTLARLFYPWMRGTRNYLLKRKDSDRIDNLSLKDTPIFQPVFGESWESLPTVFKRHYANRPYTQDTMKIVGRLDVSSKQPLLWMAPLMKLMRQIPVRNEQNVAVSVYFRSDKHSKRLMFDRTFFFKQKKPYRFVSSMIPVHGNTVVELMRFGLGWKFSCHWDGKKIVLKHIGYVFNLMGHFIPMPLTSLLGEGYAEEHAIDDSTFEMNTFVTHKLWGRVYQYKGRFELSDDTVG